MNGCHDKQPAKCHCDCMGDFDALAIDTGHQPEHQNRCRNAAGRQRADDAPVDAAVHAVNGSARRLGDGRIEQVRADRGCGMDAEKQDEKGCHQRSAADAGDADKRSDEKAGKRIERLKTFEKRQTADLSTDCETTAPAAENLTSIASSLFVFARPRMWRKVESSSELRQTAKSQALSKLGVSLRHDMR